jgi:hypothetical protein
MVDGLKEMISLFFVEMSPGEGAREDRRAG